MDLKFVASLLISIMLISYGCKDDCTSYSSKQNVDFFSTHPTVQIINAEFETVTEQYLKKEAYNVGATFETVTEQVLVSQPFTTYQAWDMTSINIVSDAENNRVSTVDCYTFYGEDDIIIAERPAVYTTRSWQKLVQNGTGDIVPAQYETGTWRLTVKDSEIIKPDMINRDFTTVSFTIPDDLSVREYLQDQLDYQGISECIEGNSYRIQ